MSADLALVDAPAILPPVAAVPFDGAALVAKIDLARRLFEDGELRAALLLSGAAYEEARAAGDYAARMKASERVIEKARLMLAEALDIESYAQVALANEYDAAQAAGLVARRGRPKKVSGENLIRLEDVGLSKERIFAARKLRDAERQAPGIILRTIRERLAAGLDLSRSNLRAAVGTASASKEDRGDNFYQTPAVATLALLALESFSQTVWEPACGHGAISRILEQQDYDVILSDLVDRGAVTADGVPQAVGDFLLSAPEQPGEGPDIVTNPPYGEHLNAFVRHALHVHKPRKLALLLNLNFQCGFADDDRNFVMDENPPSRVYVFKRRLPMMHREGWSGPTASSRMNTAWFVWERQDDGSYGEQDGCMRTRRIDWLGFADSDALAPGEGGHSSGIHFEDAPRTTPRKTFDERLGDCRDLARNWIMAQATFDRPGLRRAIGVRDTTAEGLIAELQAEGVVSVADHDGRYRPILDEVAA